ncbi:MAG TPA: signal peptidase I [Thermoleophilaceae bacterium]|nr:signal peptidase I [Thermoleophilaceae bacterium]
MPPVALRRRAGWRGSFAELALIVVVALALAFGIQAVIVKPFRIPSGSMIPTLEVVERVLVDRVSFRFSDPDRGDIVVFKPPAGAGDGRCGVPDVPGRACPEPTRGEFDQNYIKRVVGLPGDRLKVLEGVVYINGQPLEEPYLRASASCSLCRLPEEITIPPDHFFMMGDNRGQSEDSRVWGPVPEDQIVGNAFFTYWPLDRVGGL